MIFLFFWCYSGFAGVEQISEQDFRKLAEKLAPKVSLFRAVWEKDPAAEFYGGTSRDFLYWLKGKFRDVHNQSDVEKVVKELRALEVIPIKDFIIGESDVDIVGEKTPTVQAVDYGVRKIDH